jgi:hypothetical protein
MKKNTAFALAAALLIALVLFLWRTTATVEVAEYDMRTGTSTVTSVILADPQSKIENPKSKIPPARVPPAEVSHLADDLNASAGNITADLRIVADVLENFRSNFPRDGNPVGTNAEITATLTGKNKLRYAVIPPNHPAINRDGELRDRWGTPFFFHAESGSKMGVRSAGPDKKMWTDDDVVLGP